MAKARDAFHCMEVLMTHVSNVTTSYITEIYITSTLQNIGSILQVKNMQRSSDNKMIICSVNETIILTEWHSKMDIIYKYTFLNTTSHKLQWWSRFDSDIHIQIIKKMQQTNSRCHNDITLIEINHKKELQYQSKLKKPVNTFSYHPAR
jgi:hypothetical protein